MNNDSLQADCTRCAALCCVAFAFERSEGFDQEKPPATPCHHLGGDSLCTIYADRRQHGMAGCDHYTCHGAGQYVTQALFEGRSWQDDPRLLGPMVTSFLEMARLQMTLATATLAQDRNMPGTDQVALAALIADMTPDQGWSQEDLLKDSPIPVFERRLTQALSGVRSAYRA